MAGTRSRKRSVYNNEAVGNRGRLSLEMLNISNWFKTIQVARIPRLASLHLFPPTSPSRLCPSKEATSVNSLKIMANTTGALSLEQISSTAGGIGIGRLPIPCGSGVSFCKTPSSEVASGLFSIVGKIEYSLALCAGKRSVQM